MPGLAGVVLLAAAAAGVDLATPFSASSRPSLCSKPTASVEIREADSGRPTPWDGIRQSSLNELCLELSRAQIQLLQQPRIALAMAAKLARSWPGRPEPWVLQARAHTRLAAYPDAWAAWLGARERGYDFPSAHALRDYAIAGAMNGQNELALNSYRRLITLLGFWSDPLARQRLYLEAGAAALRQGPTGLDEAAGYLAWARPSASSTGLRALVAGMEALVHHRRGQPTPRVERVDAPEVWYLIQQIRSERWPSYWPVVPRHEISGAASLLVEPYSSAEAAELWELHVQGLERAGAASPWTKLARDRLARLTAQAGQAP